MANHERAPETDNKGQPYCLHCGLIEAQWILNGCSRKPTLSVVPVAELSETERFTVDPMAWVEEWNTKNGKVEIEKVEAGFAVCLWVDGKKDHPLSTGVGPNLPHAFRNAIQGLTNF